MGSSSRSEASDKLLRKAHKRKRENNESAATTTKKTKKSRRGRDTGVEEEIKSAQAEGGVQASESQTGPTAEEKAVEDDSAHKEEETRGETKGADGSDVGEKDGEDEASLEKKQKKGKGKKSKTSKEGEDVDEQTLKKRRRKEAAESPVANDIDPEMKKHASVFSKFSKSQKINEQLAATKAAKGSEEEGEEEQAEEAEKHGLEPLPQPAPAPESTEKPTYSTLPKWLTEPAVVPLEERRPFTELGVNERLLSVLQHAGYKEAFPIQSAVLQLLQAGKHKHTGDVCISAATGSGKTLAYALPVVSSIEPAPVPRLRGLIVVPTRELVRQARDSCEVCASGSGLRIGTAVGAVSLKEEQAHLMREDKIYDPLAYREQQEKLMSAADWKDFDLQRYLAESQSAVHQTPDYILRPAPNVDILVCTPGRLVDHIKSTKGFTLEHLQWLVIDEADRLLNESFQEWVDVVIPALNTTRFAREGKAAETLAKMGFPLRKQYPLRKIILSATMTRDLEKLNSLRLENPKLVVVGKSAEKDVEMAAAAADVGGPGHVPSTDEFTLPDTLVEKYVPVGDGAEKPLYLLALLLQKINVLGGMDKETARRSSVSSTSSASSSSSSDSGDSDTDSESEDGSSSSSDESSSDSDSETSSDSDSDSDSNDTKPNSNHTTRQNQTASTTSSSSTTPAALIFTKSSESAARLSRLLSLLHPPLAPHLATLTKTNTTRSMRAAISAYRHGRTRLIIATDRASRGLDLVGLGHVISYDVPGSVTSYVHRVGRTARAGREGVAWTLVARREGRWFSREIGGVVGRKDGKEDAGERKSGGGVIRRESGKKIAKMEIKLDEEGGMDGDIRGRYERALAALETEVQEQQNKTR